MNATKEMRSAWKGLYQPLSFIKQLAAKTKAEFFLYARSTWLTAFLVGQSLHIYNGKNFVSLKPTPLHVMHRVGEFARTRAFFIPKVKKKKAGAKTKRKKAKSKTKSKAKKK